MRDIVVAGAIALGAGCGSPDAGGPDAGSRGALHVDVSVSQYGIDVSVIEADRPDLCNQRAFAELGVCDFPSDAWACTDAPADWLAEVQLEVDGAVIVTRPLDTVALGTGFGRDEYGDSATRLILVADDSARAAIPIPTDVVPPRPTITEAVVNGTELLVTWTADPPAASAVVAAGAAYGGPRCHVGPDMPVSLGWHTNASLVEIYVHAFASPTAVSTAFGDAHVWIGELTTRPLFPPEPP